MGLDHLPEVKLARRLIQKHALQVPIDLESLIKQYATLIYRRIGIKGVDGVSINLKTPGKRPTVLVEESLGFARRKFTLAHELGHIIIPWHIGTIADETYPASLKDFRYAELEQEANRFAAELLMPQEWVLSEYQNQAGRLAKLHAQIITQAGVSHLAAAIRMVQILPPNIIFVLGKNGVVVDAGKTEGTRVVLPDLGVDVTEVAYARTSRVEVLRYGAQSYYWHFLDPSVSHITT